jgi:hypothetical protein
MTKTLQEKLLLKPGATIVAVDPPQPYEQIVGRLPKDATLASRRVRAADVVHLFATSRRTLDEQLPRALQRLRADGLLWISYPKVSAGSHDISREAVHSALRTNGWRPVTQISMDDVWTAIRARPVPGG